MKTLFILSTLCCVCSCLWPGNVKTDAECCPLKGVWVTENGAYIDLKHNADGTLTGTYSYLTENGRKEETIHGQAGKGKPTTFGFVVSMKNGLTTKVWTGQYQFCDREATLTTRWMMSSVTKECGDEWKANHSGEERFVRKTASKKGSKLGHYIRKVFNKLMRKKGQ